jgi:DNA-binding NtrC family response regulator
VYLLIMKARPHLKVLVCSGYSIDTARGILDAGAQDFIQKSFNVKELSQKLRGILKKE